LQPHEFGIPLADFTGISGGCTPIQPAPVILGRVSHFQTFIGANLLNRPTRDGLKAWLTSQKNAGRRGFLSCPL